MPQVCQVRVCRVTVQLRPFQSDLATRISQTWQDGARDVLGVLPCGAGKSVVAAHFLQQEQRAAMFVAHRAELVSGESLALARNGVRHRVIGQPALRRECSRRHVAEGLYDHVDMRALVAVASVDTLVGLPDSDPFRNEVRLVVTDECFPAGTLVDGTPIEQLCVGDAVTAFDEATGEFAKRRIAALYRNPMPKHMMRIETEAHHVLHCTPGHPFWTKRGWKLAHELDIDDEVYCDDSTTIVHDVLETCGYDAAASGEVVRKNREGILLERMCASVSREGVVGNSGKNKSQVRVSANGCEQPDARPSRAQENGEYATRDQTLAENTRREWAGTDRARTGFSVTLLWARVRSAVRNKNWRKTWKRHLPAVLQTRLSAPRIENRAGSRRVESLFVKPSGAGCEERRVFAWHRLDSLEVYQPHDTEQSDTRLGDGFVYNIEVEELHTYVANGVVVHNCHHLLRENKWGRALDMFPNARGLGLSATPHRADGKGLGRHADGVFDVLLEGPTAREIELMGFLAPHVIYAPPSDIDLSAVPVTGSGDYSPKPLAEATHKSHIVGDVVDHYRRLADGLLGMTFCVDVESAVETAKAFRAAGVSAEVVTGKTPPDVRNSIFRRFRNRDIMQLVSCEIAGEGFDLPDVEVISLARASQSYSLATQQIGRVKRILPGKTKGIVIDHVGNTTRHCQARQCKITGEWYIAVGEREWTLDRRERRTSSKTPLVAITTCPQCLRSYERVIGRKCPYCSHETQPAGRSAPEQVDGVLAELDPATLAQMQRDIAHVDGAPTIPWNATPNVQGAVLKRHRERQEAQAALRAAMAQWAGVRTQATDAESVARLQREFYLCFGTDIATAQALGRAEALELLGRIEG